MKEKYKIVLTCYDFDNPKPYFDEIEGVFNTVSEAERILYFSVLDELTELNDVNGDGQFSERRFLSQLHDEEHNIVINCWDGLDYSPVTCYDIIPYSKYLTNKYNMKLKKKHGADITVKIYSYIEDDGNVAYYYSSILYGDSDAYETVEQAYKEADIYLCGTGDLFV